MAESTYQCLGATVVKFEDGKCLIIANGFADGSSSGVRAVDFVFSREQLSRLNLPTNNSMKETFKQLVDAALADHADFPQMSPHQMLCLDVPYATIIWGAIKARIETGRAVAQLLSGWV